jgi:hypothetical protein
MDARKQIERTAADLIVSLRLGQGQSIDADLLKSLIRAGKKELKRRQYAGVLKLATGGRS